MVAPRSVCKLLSMRNVGNALSPMKEYYEININTDIYILFSYHKNVKSSSNDNYNWFAASNKAKCNAIWTCKKDKKELRENKRKNNMRTL